MAVTISGPTRTALPRPGSPVASFQEEFQVKINREINREVSLVEVIRELPPFSNVVDL